MHFFKVSLNRKYRNIYLMLKVLTHVLQLSKKLSERLLHVFIIMLKLNWNDYFDSHMIINQVIFIKCNYIKLPNQRSGCLLLKA